MKKYNVLVIGDLNVDLILNNIIDLPRIGSEIIANNMQLVLGSSSAIFASNISVLGEEVAFLGKIGSDMFGKVVGDSLVSKKVSTEFIIKNKSLNTGATVVLNYGEDRAMVTYPGAMELLSGNDISDDVLNSANHLHISSIFLQPLLLKDLKDVLSRAKSLGMTTSLDPQWDPSGKWEFDIAQILPYVDVFLPNKKEFLLITGSESLGEGVKKISPFANMVVVKNGSNGSYLWCKNEELTKPAFLNNNIVDCIGAGDSFDAGFISKYIQGRDNSECLEFANLCGGINTTKTGGTGAFESLDMIKEIAVESFGYNF
ncbi:MAG: carbohydrate kinase family protein [Lutibacter sp.]|uniref:carbohydrate kinase family protein n=1 Tax=Lutibacter sp. TaxID=1925666 RepID=UPI0019FF4591|nr:carbohydrate kinase family protein [Lutibacter sp.]NOR26964.1 carbohydrate kinase family protein [Lutibacter sp.]